MKPPPPTRRPTSGDASRGARTPGPAQASAVPASRSPRLAASRSLGPGDRDLGVPGWRPASPTPRARTASSAHWPRPRAGAGRRRCGGLRGARRVLAPVGFRPRCALLLLWGSGSAGCAPRCRADGLPHACLGDVTVPAAGRRRVLASRTEIRGGPSTRQGPARRVPGRLSDQELPGRPPRLFQERVQNARAGHSTQDPLSELFLERQFVKDGCGPLCRTRVVSVP